MFIRRRLVGKGGLLTSVAIVPAVPSSEDQVCRSAAGERRREVQKEKGREAQAEIGSHVLAGAVTMCLNAYINPLKKKINPLKNNITLEMIL